MPLYFYLPLEQLETAIADCKALFLLRPPAVANTKATLTPFIDVTRKAGVEQMVLGSGARDKAHQDKECDRLILMYQLRLVGWL